jgi:hypothetical protein
MFILRNAGRLDVLFSRDTLMRLPLRGSYFSFNNRILLQHSCRHSPAFAISKPFFANFSADE